LGLERNSLPRTRITQPQAGTKHSNLTPEMDATQDTNTELVSSTQTEKDVNKFARKKHCCKRILNRVVKVTTLISDSESDSDYDETQSTVEPSSAENSYDTFSSISDCSDDELFEVERISSVRAFKTNDVLIKQFLVKWKGYQHKSWVDETDLQCPDILKQFFETRGNTDVEPRAGAANKTDQNNLDNWITPTRLLETTNSYKNSNRHRANIEIKLFQNLENKDNIYIIMHECHYFVLMHYHERRIGYISDGMNLFTQNAITRQQIKRILGGKMKLIPLTNTIQRAQDHCGSTAAALAITFLQRYQTDRWINPVPVAPTLVSRLANLLHKHPSVNVYKQKINNYAIYCRTCGKRFYKNTRHAAHERFCKPSKN